MYKRLTELNEELFTLRHEKNVRGKSVGWDWDLLPYTIKEGCTTYIGAAPASGKTKKYLIHPPNPAEKPMFHLEPDILLGLPGMPRRAFPNPASPRRTAPHQTKTNLNKK